METNLKIWKGMTIYVFRDKGKFVGCLGVKIPLIAQQILNELENGRN